MLLLVAWIIWNNCTAQISVPNYALSILPKPVSVSLQQGYFLFNPRTAIISADTKSAGIASFLSDLFHHKYGYDLKNKSENVLRSSVNAKAEILMRINKKPDVSIGDEGYDLKVTASEIILSANNTHGLFYGVQTLLQLLPPLSNGEDETKNGRYKIPCVNIKDYPRFGYRGIMLDVSRRFFSKEFVEKYIDEMAKYKFNTFHWHLTDDNGWRIEIKGLPELTEIGAWRVPRVGSWHKFESPQPGEKATYGGYYTQDDIREIVKYAQERFITIIPEIDVPAHSLALISSYPNLSCTQLQYSVNPGSPFYKKEDNVLCVANDSTWLILDKIFTQVAHLFPGKYIHIGGDEAYKGFWELCPKDQALMKQEGLDSVDELQSFFVKKLEKLIIAKGKKMIGWDEILEGGLAPEVTVMSWRGMKGGVEAAKMGHEVIMTPILETYLSRRQGDPSVEPFAPGMLRLSDCYNFDPVPDSVNPKYILGGQASLWTEYVPNERHAEYMTWPRAMAISEVLWSPKAQHDRNDFVQRVEQQFRYLDADSIKYARSIYDPIVTAVKGDDDSMKIEISTEMPGLTIYYTFDGTNPDNFYPKYTGVPLDIPKGASEIRAIAYRRGRPVSKQIICVLSELKTNLLKDK